MSSTKKVNQELQKWLDLLTAVFTLCSLNSKLDRETLDHLIKQSRTLAERRLSKLRPNRRRTVDLDVLGLVIYRWQRTAKYLDDSGRPLQLPAYGRMPSIQSIFHEVGQQEYFELGFKHLSQLKRIARTRSGRYVPIGEVSILPRFTPEVAEMVALTLNRLLTTVTHNTSLKQRAAIRLIERNTAVPDLPRSQVKAFKLFAREQGAILIDTMNDWLESRRGKSARRRTRESGHLTAGLNVFAFVEHQEN